MLPKDFPNAVPDKSIRLVTKDGARFILVRKDVGKWMVINDKKGPWTTVSEVKRHLESKGNTIVFADQVRKRRQRGRGTIFARVDLYADQVSI